VHLPIYSENSYQLKKERKGQKTEPKIFLKVSEGEKRQNKR